jgi:hypothetical protein
MKSDLINDTTIKDLISQIERYPSKSLDEVSYNLDYNSIEIFEPENCQCNNVIGIDGSVKLITDRLSYHNHLTNQYQTYIINPIIFTRTVSVHSSNPFLKENKTIVIEKLKQFPLDDSDRKTSITRIESEQLQLMEINHIYKVINEETNYGDILLLDMALHRKQYESEIVHIINKCKKKGVNVVGWAKDSEITSQDGLSYTDAAKIIAIKKGVNAPWYTKHPYFKSKEIEVYLYHPPWGSFCFRTDIVPSSLTTDEIYSQLINCSKHSLGYPLVLYKAHQKVKINQDDADFVFRKMRKIAASEGKFIDRPGLKPFHERYLDL